MKRCRQCERELDESQFHRAAANADGLNNRCKSCIRAASRAYYAAHREEQIAKAKEWQKAHPAEVRASRRSNHQSARHKRYMADYRHAHKAERRERDMQRLRNCTYCGAEMEHRAWLEHRNTCPDRPLSRHAVYRPGHPLATGKLGKVATHRFVLYEAIGPGPHQCYWCRDDIEWTKGGAGPGCPKGTLAVDHLDGDRHNNERENLVESCNACNTLRGLILGWEDRTGLEITEVLL